MIVCICSEVRDSQIKSALASGVTTLDGLKSSLDIANCCGCCEPMVNDLLEEHHANNTDMASVNTLAYSV